MPVGCFKNVLFVQKISIYFLGLHGGINYMMALKGYSTFFGNRLILQLPLLILHAFSRFSDI